MREELREQLGYFLDERMEQAVFSNPCDRDLMIKSKVRPLLMKQNLVFQAEEFKGKQVFHKNMDKEDAIVYMSSLLDGTFRQMELTSQTGSLRVLVSRRGTVTVKIKKDPVKMTAKPVDLSHNRQKRHILKEGIPVPFLEDLGVLTPEGNVVHAKYNKYKQINRFLEFIEDVLPSLPKNREITIIDFGCGKSYLTFAMYYYLNELMGYPIRIIGLDLKQDVINRCNRLSCQYGFENLHFYHGDIATYEGISKVDMVVTLHACDTATDFALAKAVKWGASIILSVPCCQHELNMQMDNLLLEPIYKYGLIKERMAALYTDAIRAELLEGQGYRTQILEFIDMEHTPKNILIRAVRQGEKKDNLRELNEIMSFLSVRPSLYDLLRE